MSSRPTPSSNNTPAPTPNEPKLTKTELEAQQVQTQHNIVRFRGQALLLVAEPFPHYITLTEEVFKRVAYPIIGGVSRGKMGDLYSFVRATAPDATVDENYILFGVTSLTHDPVTHDPIPPTHEIWDMRQARRVTDPSANASACIWRSPYSPISNFVDGTHVRMPFVLELAGGDEDVYDDIMQSIAPLIMDKKPDGAIWWVGDGANGKSTLMDALYKIFPDQLASLTVKRLSENRDTLGLNGKLANIVKESSEGRVDDTEIYKAIGTHEDFAAHKFYSQEIVMVRGNLHHIFSANNIPVFNDKTHAARRRTFIIPFRETFKSDPDFEAQTFTPEFFGRLIGEMLYYAVRIRQQGYKYKWSPVTLAAKVSYDTEVNTAEQYATYLIERGVVGFESFGPVRMDYVNWCLDHGYDALGTLNMRRAIQNAGFIPTQVRLNDQAIRLYKLATAEPADLELWGMSMPRAYTTRGFKVLEEIDPLTEQLPLIPPPAPKTPPPPKFLKGNW